MIITLNEERNIARAIDSVLNVADEIVVLDSYSKDRTEEICQSKGVKFIQREWMGYAQTKNYANSLTENEWIFSLDADEALDEQMQEDVLRLKQEGFKGIYSANRLTNYCGKWIKYSTWYPDWKIRLFPKSKAKWDGEFVHEELEFSEPLESYKLKGHLHHFSYYTHSEHRRRADRYSVLTAKKLHAAGKTAGPFRPFVSGIGRFITMFILNLGFLDGWAGYKIAKISAESNVLKYKMLRKLNQNNG